MSETPIPDLHDEIAYLEQQLQTARKRLAESTTQDTTTVPPTAHHISSSSPPSSDPPFPLPSPSSLSASHTLYLLSDSALPLGSFAYSSGLESYIAHHKPLPRTTTPTSSFHRFLRLSLASVASTTLPYLLAAYRCPSSLETLDNDLDASTPCTVARRASIAQGLALLGVWERALVRGPLTTGANNNDNGPRSSSSAAISALTAFSSALKQPTPSSSTPIEDRLNGHFAPLWGVVCLALGIETSQAAYIFLLNHSKAVLSAAVRASVMGPYQAQGVLASQELRGMIVQEIRVQWETKVEEAGQVVPLVDLWMGRHELLYSRIFNS
ncbi:hypothetical protein AJ80_08726 [Polytolypa hystricis UAMH7299]|uniref:Urease accessory protein UreF n=1 Tax=Polytolypa hystricis (strain UAMH7299) TaxID=1447883 RepID=A0A2B7X329_POLH7|nr:hypothetical protein AJ80_08726 [Polytolypa hystricis UAMH7299]